MTPLARTQLSDPKQSASVLVAAMAGAVDTVETAEPEPPDGETPEPKSGEPNPQGQTVTEKSLAQLCLHYLGICLILTSSMRAMVSIGRLCCN